MPQYVQQEQYTPFVRPYVEGPVKEYAALQKQLIADYDDATMQYDALQEAADNMTSLDFEGDVKAKNEAFKFASQAIDEAAKAGDYENRGRLVRKAIKDFKTRYAPIAQQIKDRQEAFEAIDKDDKIIGAEKAEAKRLFDAFYASRKGLQKDPTSNNYIGYSSAIAPIKNVPKTVDLIKKISEGFSGAIPEKVKREVQDIINSPGSEYDKMMRTREVLREGLTPAQVDSIFEQVWNDPEVKGYNDYWAFARSYKATPDDALSIINNKVKQNAQRLLKVNPDKYKGMSEEELIKASQDNLIANGYDINKVVENINKTGGRDIVASAILQDKFNEARNFVYEKYGHQTTFDAERFTDTSASRALNGEGFTSPAPDVRTNNTPGVDENGEVNPELIEQTMTSSYNNLAQSFANIASDADTSKGLQATAGYVAGLKSAYKTPEAMYERIKQLAATTKGEKGKQYKQLLEVARENLIEYQNAANTKKEVEAIVKPIDTELKTVDAELAKAPNLEGDKKKAFDVYLANQKNAHLFIAGVIPFEDGNKLYKIQRIGGAIKVTVTSKTTGKTETSYIEGKSMELLNKKQELLESKEDKTKQYYSDRLRNTSIETVNTIGDTPKERLQNEQHVKEIATKKWLLSQANGLKVSLLKSGNLGELTNLSTLIKNGDIALDDENISGEYVLPNIIPGKGGAKENGIIIKTPKGNFFIPRSQVGINALENVAAQRTSLDATVSRLKSMTASTFELDGLEGDFVENGEVKRVTPKNKVKITFNANRIPNIEIIK